MTSTRVMRRYGPNSCSCSIRPKSVAPEKSKRSKWSSITPACTSSSNPEAAERAQNEAQEARYGRRTRANGSVARPEGIARRSKVVSARSRRWNGNALELAPAAARLLAERAQLVMERSSVTQAISSPPRGARPPRSSSSSWGPRCTPSWCAIAPLRRDSAWHAGASARFSCSRSMRCTTPGAMPNRTISFAHRGGADRVGVGTRLVGARSRTSTKGWRSSTPRAPCGSPPR